MEPLNNKMKSVYLDDTQYNFIKDKWSASFPIMNFNGDLFIDTTEKFEKKLKCLRNEKLKVVSIFGKAGDATSIMMNRAFFGGKEIFNVSATHSFAVHAARNFEDQVIYLECIGFNTGKLCDQLNKILVMLLAISDVVIYHTGLLSVDSDVHDFLQCASTAFKTYLAIALLFIDVPATIKEKAPAFIAFRQLIYEPSSTNIIKFNDDTKAFSSMRYIGKQCMNKPADYRSLKQEITLQIKKNNIRSLRTPKVILKILQDLHLMLFCKGDNKFLFPEQYFTCTINCVACGQRCNNYMGHMNDCLRHETKGRCSYNAEYMNKEYICRRCWDKRGVEVKVDMNALPKSGGSLYTFAQYAWKGSAIYCPHCGEIYRAREYWYGNKSPEVYAVRHDVVHVWSDIPRSVPTYEARNVLEGATQIGQAISNYLSEPIKRISDTIADTVAPSYWKPNDQIESCYNCNANFEKSGLHKHHCRACGEGFCHSCSKHNIEVPGRAWHSPVRVCTNCYHALVRGKACELVSAPTSPIDVFPRKCGETILNTIKDLKATAWNYPKDIITEFVRPTYWVSDSATQNCYICKAHFGSAEELEIAEAKGLLVRGRYNSRRSSKSVNKSCERHHCRRCGQAVCDACSRDRQRVPEFGWKNEVRVCDGCI